jgi:hypothetical protein
LRYPNCSAPLPYFPSVRTAVLLWSIEGTIHLEKNDSWTNPPWRAGCGRARQRSGKPENNESELFRYRNSPERCETERTQFTVLLAGDDGLVGWTRMRAWPRQLAARLGRRHRPLNIQPLSVRAIGTCIAYVASVAARRKLQKKPRPTAITDGALALARV